MAVWGFAAGALAFSYLGVAVLRRWAERRQVLDIPNERSSHTRPTPRGGGLAIVAVVLLGGALLLLIEPAWPLSQWLAFMTGAGLVAAIGWLDDLRPLSRRIRFTMHLAAALLAILAFGSWRNVEWLGGLRLALGWLGLPITLFWIAGMTNAYNFMDGIDGLAAGMAVIAGAFWAIAGMQEGPRIITIMGALIAAASLGFLLHNWCPARIFMGDVGSGFLGYTFAVMPLAAIVLTGNPAYFAAGALFVGPFIFDAGYTLVRRALRRENVFRAHRCHLYQRLVILGLSHRQTALIYYGLGVLSGAAGLGYVYGWEPAASVLAACSFIALTGLVIGVNILERRVAVPGAQATR